MGNDSHIPAAETEDRLVELQDRLQAMENADRAGSLFARAMRYFPLLALGNLLIAVPALVVSVTVAYFTFEQADATRKMQIATVWPHISYDTGNLDDDGNSQMNFNLANSGVGPARIEGMQVSLDGTPYKTIQELLRGCCARRGDPIAVVMSRANGEVIAPGEEITFAAISPEGVSPDVYQRIENVRLRVRTQICFCSVFDECWIEDSHAISITPVKLCPTEWTQYDLPDFARPGR